MDLLPVDNMDADAPAAFRARREERPAGVILEVRRCDAGDAARELSGVGIGVISVDLVLSSGAGVVLYLLTSRVHQILSELYIMQ